MKRLGSLRIGCGLLCVCLRPIGGPCRPRVISPASGHDSTWQVRCDLMRRYPSVITLKPAIRYQFKTGQLDWPKT
jgi:hypothetical protein